MDKKPYSYSVLYDNYCVIKLINFVRTLSKLLIQTKILLCFMKILNILSLNSVGTSKIPNHNKYEVKMAAEHYVQEKFFKRTILQ